MAASSFLRSPYLAAVVVGVFVFGGTPWLVYSIGLWAAGELPEPPKQIAPADELNALWERLRGEGEPHVVSLTPYTYIAKVENPGVERPGLLATYTVAADHLQTRYPIEGSQWWALTSASLTIWLTRNWTIEQILSKMIEDRNERNAARAETSG
jgi:hypothetical protein